LDYSHRSFAAWIERAGRLTQEANIWTLEGQSAWLTYGETRGRVDLTRPDLGMQDLRFDAAAIAGPLLAISPSDRLSTWPATLTDTYVRGTDLVATYAGSEAWPYAPQIYWSQEKVDGREVLAALALVISIQTDLLDTHPRIVVRSALQADEILLVSVAGDDLLVDSHVAGVQSIDSGTTTCGLIWRLPGGHLSYTEIMPTSDFCQLEISGESGGKAQSRWELFSEFLEKGVIRRARLQSLVVPQENDVQLVAERCQAIERGSLPLTT